MTATKPSVARMRTPAKQADWLTPSHPVWAAVEDRLRDIALIDTGVPLQYGLPPVHAFSGGGTGQKIHNWLRIRTHCFDALTTGDKPFALTTNHWRVALDGRYYQSTIPDGTTIMPRAPLAKIAMLPPAPASSQPEHDSTGSKTSRGADSRLHRLMERIDIAVHFGVDCGLPPYDRNVTPLPTWRGQSVGRDRAESDRNLWAEVAWQVSVANFRLDLLWFDAEVMAPVLAKGKDASLRQDERFSLWQEVWSDHRGIVTGTDPAAFDWMLSPKWIDRATALHRMTRLVRDWPGFPPLPPSMMPITAEQGAMERFELDFFEKYCRYFQAKKGRLPLFPLSRPSTILQNTDPEPW